MINPVQNIQRFTQTLRCLVPQIVASPSINKSFHLGETTLSPHFKNEETNKFFKQILDLLKNHASFTFKTNFFKRTDILFENTYDCAVKKCIIAFANYQNKTGKDFIAFSTPEVFKNLGLNKREISEFIDRNADYIKTKQSGRLPLKGVDRNHYLKFEPFQQNVFKLSIGKNKSILKFCYHSQLAGHDAYSELAIARSALKEGVGNIPLLHIASPTPQKGWLLYEFITLDKHPKTDYSIFSFLKKYGYTHSDKHLNQFVGRYLVDLGGIERKIDFQ